MTQNHIHTYVLCSKQEQGREGHINLLKQQLGDINCVEAIFPKFQKVPFIQQLVAVSKSRTGKALNQGEIGCLLGHRKIWHLIAKHTTTPNQHFLVLESDSKIVYNDDFKRAFIEINNANNSHDYDLFFWGAWNGNTRIKKSTQSKILKKFNIGEPLIKSVYGTYGYSITPIAAKILLKQTAKISYPVDYFKHHLINADIQIGAIRPAMIDTWKTTPSNIVVENNWVNIKRWIIIRVFDFRNMIIAYFC